MAPRAESSQAWRPGRRSGRMKFREEQREITITIMSAELEKRVVSYFRAQAGRFDLDAATLKAERVLNWGGFVAHSFKVGDGKRSLHVKLASGQEGMRRWLAFHDRLEQQYRAPRVLAWVDIPDTSLGGPGVRAHRRRNLGYGHARGTDP